MLPPGAADEEEADRGKEWLVTQGGRKERLRQTVFNQEKFVNTFFCLRMSTQFEEEEHVLSFIFRIKFSAQKKKPMSWNLTKQRCTYKPMRCGSCFK